MEQWNGVEEVQKRDTSFPAPERKASVPIVSPRRSPRCLNKDLSSMRGPLGHLGRNVRISIRTDGEELSRGR